MTDVVDRGGQPVFKHGQIEGAAALVNLNGIAAAHGDVRLGFAIEIGKFAADANRAFGHCACTRTDWKWPVHTSQEIRRPCSAASRPAKQLHGFGGLERSDQIHDGAEDADGVASLLEALAWSRWAESRQARHGGYAGTNGHGQAVAGRRRRRKSTVCRTLTAKSLTRKRVSKLSVPSRIRSKPASNSSALCGFRSATMPSTDTLELMDRSLRSAATALGRASRASASSNRVWRCRFEGSTKSRSMMRMRPTPARTSKLAVAAPIAPQPTIDGAGGEQALLALFADAGEKNLARVFLLERIVHGAVGLSGVDVAPHAAILTSMIAPKFAGQATPLCYPSSERKEA